MNDQASNWLRSRTFSAPAFDLGELAAAKGSTRVSVVVPARNEAATIGKIITSIGDDHLAGSGLIDELIVIDSDSTDDTAQVAEAAGAAVFRSVEISPELGWRPGKGEAMWKSLLVSNGEIIVYIDADLVHFTSLYVTGLLGPLLLHDDVLLVKGFYDRNLIGATSGDGVAQGGRVTELTARPVTSLWWPDLAGVIQPLSGEWAGRRSLLESLPFPSGYGVEVGVLIDSYERFGLSSIAQVDLGNREHIHQDLTGLGVVAAEVLAAATQRRFGEAPAEGAEISQPLRAQDDDNVTWTPRSINSAERPPAISLPGYGAEIAERKETP